MDRKILEYYDLLMLIVGLPGAATAKSQGVLRMRVRAGRACREWSGRGDAAGNPVKRLD